MVPTALSSWQKLDLDENQLVTAQTGKIDVIQEMYFTNKTLHQTVPEMFFH